MLCSTAAACHPRFEGAGRPSRVFAREESPIGAKRVTLGGDGPRQTERWISAESAGSVIIFLIRLETLASLST